MQSWTQLPSAKCNNLLRKTKLQNLSSPHSPHTEKRKKIINRSALPKKPTFHLLYWHKGLLLRLLEPPVPQWWDQMECVIPSSPHTKHTDCSSRKWKCPRKRKWEAGAPSHSFPEGGAQEKELLPLDTENKASLRLSIRGGSLAFREAKSGTAFPCLSTTDRASHGVETSGNVCGSIPASFTEQWPCHVEIPVECWPLSSPPPSDPRWGYLFLVCVFYTSPSWIFSSSLRLAFLYP